ncbi:MULTISPECIES: hypothetical protein [Bacillus cereus group]|uniref:hypothetical protein n=1 Tax=Bacillus cereus group TaxID=86661 RepID=UPI000BFC51DB|nr:MULTISPECIES: hypothetical protein [Bacillus cereus group]MDM5463561.1 hypothetical protein [Bacillus cereus]PGY15650.1 hypothetical protein COE23_10555 [Bacillus cereus]QWI50622.1 hypothetical protein EXW56_17685 [Bacillus mycoides]WJE18667.1 hypothetical protein QRY07_18175 [Bacillus cereus]
MEKGKSAILRGILYIYFCLYILMYITFIFVIDMVHVSLSVMSIFLVVMPFVLLVIIQKFSLHVSAKRNKGKKQLFTVMMVGLIPLIVCIVQLSINAYTSNFNQERWLNYKEKRVYMVDNLLEENKMIGKSNEEITKLLGAPTETRSWEEGITTLYYLGSERGFISIDSECLVLQFDRDGRVIEYKVQRD